YRQALERPGAIVLRHTFLHDLVLSVMVERREFSGYRTLMERRYGAPGREMAGRVLLGQHPLSVFAFPLIENVVEAAEQLVVQSRAAQDNVTARHPRARVRLIPLGVRLPPAIDRRAARAQLALPADEFLLVSLAPADRRRRLDVVLDTVARLRRELPVRLVLAGPVDPDLPLESLIGAAGLDGVAEAWGAVDRCTGSRLHAAADACLYLRSPWIGESSVSLLRAMGAGRAAVVSDTGWFAELPNDAVAKVAVDVLEDETLCSLLRTFATEPELAQAVGHRARAYVARAHSLQQMVAGFHQLLQELTGVDLPPPHGLPGVSLEVTAPNDDPARSPDPLLDDVGAALAELGIGGGRWAREAARAAVELGLGSENDGANVQEERDGERGEADQRGAARDPGLPGL
ncbi:MAG TPA: glycosyltransferase family 4 protein, partial [Nitrolancea sp.]|nr:glycosyltransferase family 4 protein [Nitrolancea sp.]